MHDVYWHPHIDKENTKHYDYSGKRGRCLRPLLLLLLPVTAAARGLRLSSYAPRVTLPFLFSPYSSMNLGVLCVCLYDSPSPAGLLYLADHNDEFQGTLLLPQSTANLGITRCICAVCRGEVQLY